MGEWVERTTSIMTVFLSFFISQVLASHTQKKGKKRVEGVTEKTEVGIIFNCIILAILRRQPHETLLPH